MGNDELRQLLIDTFRVAFRIGELRMARLGEMADANTIDAEAASYALIALDEDETDVVVLTQEVRE
jgi:hypothetical protein